MRGVTAMAKKSAGKSPEKKEVIQVKLYRTQNHRLGIIAEFLKLKEGREMSLAETLEFVAGDVINAFYAKALREMQQDIEE